MVFQMEERFVLDSAYLVVFERIREQLEAVLRAKGGMNLTQFRLFLKAADGEENSLLLDMGQKLHLKANVVTQAADVLEQQGVAIRVISDKDARAKSIQITPHGRKEIKRINGKLRDSLYAAFNPTRDILYDEMLEASIEGAAMIEESLSPSFKQSHRASAAMITYCLIEQSIIDHLKLVTGASFSECRILQRLAETGEPMRSVDLANQLVLPPTTIMRSTIRLERRGWLQRLASSANLQAVFVNVTKTGGKKQILIQKTIDEWAEQIFWKRLEPKYREQIIRVGDIFAQNMQASDCIRHRTALLKDLKPILQKKGK
ncbi:helix-turn-helix domain-containing protein [Treponema sp.]|uniref:helix-turn-helix domain-containing protein n=1 Tax=Treponema sp. TaxID=166 RepID=UPI003FA30240